MNRRELFKSFGLTLGGIAIDQAIPLNRVWSFPSKIVLSTLRVKLISPWRPAGVSTETNFITMEWISRYSLAKLKENMQLTESLHPQWAAQVPAWPAAD